MRVKHNPQLIALTLLASLLLASHAPYTAPEPLAPALHQPSVIYAAFGENDPEASVPATDAEAATDVGEAPFSIVWLADTQAMAYKGYCDALASMGDWIVREKEARNIRYVVQTGDLVDNGFSQEQWCNFEALYRPFCDELPYLPIAGNHDLGVKLAEYDAYLEQPFVKSLPQTQLFEQGRAAYATFQAGTEEWIIIGVGWNAELESADWIHTVLQAHAADTAILLVHSYIETDGSFSEHGEEIHDAIVKPNPNIRLVLSGHVRGSGFRTEEFDDNGDGVNDRRVQAMIYNYQHYDRNCGQLRVLTFNPEDHSIRVMTYSPFTQIYYRDEHFKTEEFVLEQAF